MMTWNEVIMYIINTVFKLIIMVLIPYGVNLIRTKLKSDMQNKYLDRAEQLIKDAVNQVQQTYVENMKAEDLFDKSAQVEAFDKVKANVLSMMNEEMMNVVVEAVGDFDEWIRNKIEAQVFTNKQNETVIANELPTGEKSEG